MEGMVDIQEFARNAEPDLPEDQKTGRAKRKPRRKKRRAYTRRQVVAQEPEKELPDIAVPVIDTTETFAMTDTPADLNYEAYAGIEMALDEAVEVVSKRFSELSDQAVDVLAKAIVFKLSKADRDWLVEIVRITSRPLWQVLLGQYIRNRSHSAAQAPFFDPSWQPGALKHDSPVDCQRCGVQFMPSRYGQLFCSNECGSARIAM
jgi:hypothetical protein